MGQYVLDPCILKLYGFSQGLWKVQDCASDMIILNISSGETIDKINIVENISAGSRAVLSTTLYFT